jgi:predicted  nucleic acid-binding Zn-ribbon protein
MPDIVTNVLYAEIDRLRARVKEQDEVYDALSVSFDALRKKYHDLAHDFFHKNAALVAANHRVRELEAERDGYRNGQMQLQDTLSTVMDSNAKWAAENKRLRKRIAELEAEMREIGVAT